MPVRRSPLLDFAERHYDIAPPAPIIGKFRIENSPWLAEPMHALCDPEIREVTTQLAAQGGKNLIAEILIAYNILHNPGNILFYGQTDDDAEMFAATRALPRLRSIPILKHVIPNTTAARKNNQIHFGYMSLEFLGINEANTRGKSAPTIMCDELHLPRWKGMQAIAKKRGGAFWDKKIFNLSTAGDEGSEIDLVFANGSMEDWFLGCPECKKPVKLSWSESEKVIIWDVPEELRKILHPNKGVWNFTEVRKHVRFRCPWPECNAEFRDSRPIRLEMNLLGDYYAQNINGSPEHRSFHCSRIAYIWAEWAEIVEEWINAYELSKTGDQSRLRIFIIETLGETWRNLAPVDTGDIKLDDYQVTGGMVFYWKHEKGRFATVDVQQRGNRHFWLVIRAWAAGGASRFIHAARVESWEMLKEIIERYKVTFVGVDSKFATEEVKQHCAENGWFFMEADNMRLGYVWKGPGKTKISKPFKPAEWKDTRRNADGVRRFARGITFSKNWVRGVLANRIAGQGSPWGLPSDIGSFIFLGTNRIKSSYLDQLNSWVYKEFPNKRTGGSEWTWYRAHRDDHLRACEEMQLVLAAIEGYFPSEIDSKKELDIEPE